MIRRALRYLLISIAGLIGLIVIAVGAFWWSSIPPSDASLQRRFVAHRADLERLVAMMNEDIHMARIAADFTRNDDWATRSVGRYISPWRWDEYRALFRKVGLGHGTYRDEKSCDVGLIAWDRGLVLGGISMVYVHCGVPTKNLGHTEPACLAKEDAGTFSDERGTSRYRKLAESWYLSERRF